MARNRYDAGRPKTDGTDRLIETQPNNTYRRAILRPWTSAWWTCLRCVGKRAWLAGWQRRRYESRNAYACPRPNRRVRDARAEREPRRTALRERMEQNERWRRAQRNWCGAVRPSYASVPSACAVFLLWSPGGRVGVACGACARAGRRVNKLGGGRRPARRRHTTVVDGAAGRPRLPRAAVGIIRCNPLRRKRGCPRPPPDPGHGRRPRARASVRQARTPRTVRRRRFVRTRRNTDEKYPFYYYAASNVNPFKRVVRN